MSASSSPLRSSCVGRILLVQSSPPKCTLGGGAGGGGGEGGGEGGEGGAWGTSHGVGGHGQHGSEEGVAKGVPLGVT